MSRYPTASISGSKSRFIEMFGNPKTNSKCITESSIEDISDMLIAGGDKPKDYSLLKQGDYVYPIWANGEQNKGLQGFSKSFRIDKESLTISARGSIGYCEIREPYYTPVVRLISLVPKRFVDLVYLKYFFDLTGFVKTGAVQGQLTIPELKKKTILVPSIIDQGIFRRIVEQADKSGFVDCKSRFIEMFGDSSIHKKWPIKLLKDIVHPDCPISYGIVQPGDGFSEGVPVVRPVDLNANFYVYRNGLKLTSPEISNSYKRTVLRGDEVLLCVRGTTGLMGLATEELKGCNVTRGITPLYFQENFNRFYMLGVFLSEEVQAYIAQYTIGSTLKGINMERVRQIPIPIPPLKLQNEWERIFCQADKSGLVN